MGVVSAIYRHPVKGFTPERLDSVDLAPGEGFPHDRIFAVENGPSGFDPDAPAFVSKQKFTVLAAIAAVARVRTLYDEASGRLDASATGRESFAACLRDDVGRAAFAAWLTPVLGEDVRGDLRVVSAPRHHFTDHPSGQVSIINLASVRDLGARLGVELDPTRFRGNLYVEGWPPWIENGWAERRIALGPAAARVFKPIVRCAAVDVDPTTATRDLEIPRALFDNYGHMFCGIYVHITAPGRIAAGDAIKVLSEEETWP